MTRQTSVSSPALLHWDGKYHGVAFIQVVGSALAVKLQETIRPKLTCEGDVDETTPWRKRRLLVQFLGFLALAPSEAMCLGKRGVA
jgi:hypothetical protein